MGLMYRNQAGQVSVFDYNQPDETVIYPDNIVMHMCRHCPWTTTNGYIMWLIHMDDHHQWAI